MPVQVTNPRNELVPENMTIRKSVDSGTSLCELGRLQTEPVLERTQDQCKLTNFRQSQC